MRNVVVLVVASVLSTHGSGPAIAQGKMTALPLSVLGRLSADGKIAVGTYGSGRACRWEEGIGSQDRHAQGDPEIPGCVRVSISRDGQTIIGCVQVNRVQDVGMVLSAGIWQGGQNWRDIGSLGRRPVGAIVTRAFAVSADGSIIVGASYNPEGYYRAFRWTEMGGMVDLGAMMDGGSSGDSRINGISPDGNLLVRWDQDPDMQNYFGRQARRGAGFLAGRGDVFVPPVGAASVLGWGWVAHHTRSAIVVRLRNLRNRPNFVQLSRNQRLGSAAGHRPHQTPLGVLG